MTHDHDQKYRDFQEGLTAYLSRKLAPTKKRRSDKAIEFAPLLAWHQRPEETQVLGTNWRLVSADNDNKDVRMDDMDKSREFTPSIPEIKRAIASVEASPFRHAKLGGGDRPTELYPVARNVEYGVHVDDGGKPWKIVERIGKLRFSDGTQTEWGFKLGIDGDAVKARVRVPTGGMLGTRERLTRMKGKAPSSVGSNSFFAKALGAEIPKYIPGSRKKRPTRQTPEWSNIDKRKAFLRDLGVDGSVPYDVARANAGLPPKEKPTAAALPSGSRTVAELFMGMRKVKTGKGGALRWQDIFVAERNADMWHKVHAEMSEIDRTVLDAGAKARGYESIGNALGHTGLYARKVGRRALEATNDNLRAAIEKFAA